MSIRESDIPRQLPSDREYRPQTESEKKRSEILKHVNDANALMGRLQQKFGLINEGVKTLLTTE